MINLDIFAAVMPYVSTALTSLFAMMFYSSIYKARFPGKVSFIVGWFAMFASATAVNTLGLPAVNMVMTVAVYNLVPFVLFTPKLSTGLMYNQLYIMLIMMCDGMTAFIASAGNGVTLDRFVSDSQVYAVASVPFIGVVFAGSRILSLFLTKRAKWKIRIAEIIVLFILMAFELYVGNYLYHNAHSVYDVYNTIIILAGFAFINAIVTYEIHKLSMLYKTKYEADVQRQQTHLELSHYNELIANYDRYRVVVHDIRKHLGALTAMSADQTPAYHDYAKSISEKMERMFDEFRCTSRILSIIMTQKIRSAESFNIRLILRIEDIDLSFMRDADITAVFANLWDNAIDAVLNLPEADRVISVTLVKKNTMVMARFENPFNGKLRKLGDTYLTTKGAGHTGSGLSIVRAAAENSGGRVVLKSGEGVFSVMILLPTALTGNNADNSTDNTADFLSEYTAENSDDEMGVLFITPGEYLNAD
jgi:hypothetical protein